MNEKRKKSVLILILVIAGLFAFIFIAGKTNITQIITPSYKLASTPYATLVYIGNGTAKVGGIVAIRYTENITLNGMGEVSNNNWQYSDIHFPYNNITIDNKTFAIANESITISNTITEIKQQIPLSAFASKNGTLYYIRLINFSNYYGVIIPANFMNKSNISLPFRITPYPSCPIIPAVSNANALVFNRAFSNIFGIPSVYAYTGVVVSKNTTGIVGNKQYPFCYPIIEIIPSFNISSCSVNDVSLNCTYYNNYPNLVKENPVYPQIKVDNTYLNINNHIKGVWLN